MVVQSHMMLVDVFIVFEGVVDSSEAAPVGAHSTLANEVSFIAARVIFLSVFCA